MTATAAVTPGEWVTMSKVSVNSDVNGFSMPKSLFGYDVLDFIGEGAGSVIYAVSRPDCGQIYALKHVVRRNDKDVRFIEQLENEYEVSQKFAHEGLRRSIDVKVVRTLLRKPVEAMLVMELFDGMPLDAHNARNVKKTVDVFIQVAHALDSLHTAGLVHCDLKPNNILVNSKDQVKVIDFGQACPVGTAKSRIQGTPDFISPEQVKCEPVDVRTDVFNFGATLYWALTTKSLPTLFNIKKSENSFLFDSMIPNPAALNPKVPESLSNLIMECVKTNPDKRPADLKEVGRRLEIIRHAMNRQDNQAASTVA
jgi:eukaryotic-like serine/threonine-protein kinase